MSLESGCRTRQCQPGRDRRPRSKGKDSFVSWELPQSHAPARPNVHHGRWKPTGKSGWNCSPARWKHPPKPVTRLHIDFRPGRSRWVRNPARQSPYWCHLSQAEPYRQSTSCKWKETFDRASGRAVAASRPDWNIRSGTALPRLRCCYR